MDERSGKLIRQVIVPIAVLVAVAMSVVVGFIWFSAKNQDGIALRQSIEGVRDAISAQTDQVGVEAKDYSWWTDAVRNLDLAFDPEWADTNIGSYIYEQFTVRIELRGRSGEPYHLWPARRPADRRHRRRRCSPTGSIV